MAVIPEKTTIQQMSLVARAGRKLKFPTARLLRIMGAMLPESIDVSGSPIRLSSQNDPDLSFLRSLLPTEKHFCSSICKNNISPEADYDLQIIAPVYNVEKYIDECIDSIIGQKTDYSFLLTITNDGSTDGSRDRLKRYEHLPNIEIIDQKNQGLSSARNRCLRNIRARYITFVDSDDRLQPGAITALMDAATKYDADIVEGSYKRLQNGTLFDGYSHKFSIADGWNGQLNGYAWAKLFRSELFRRRCFPEGYLYEDSLMSLAIYLRCKRIVTIPDDVYAYRVNPTSILSTTKKSPRVVEALLVTLQLLEDNHTCGLQPDQQLYDNFLQFDVRNDFFTTSALGSSKVNQHVFSATCRIMEQYFKGFSTRDENLKPLERALRKHDYRGYIIAIL